MERNEFCSRQIIEQAFCQNLISELFIMDIYYIQQYQQGGLGIGGCIVFQQSDPVIFSLDNANVKNLNFQ